MKWRALWCVALVCSVAVPVSARRRAVLHPVSEPQRIRAELLANSERIIARVLALHPAIYRNHWQNGAFLMGMLATAAAKEQQSAGAGQPLLQAVAAVIDSRDWGGLPDDCSAYHGDCTTFAQAALKLRAMTPDDPAARERWLATVANPMAFANHALRDTPTNSPPHPEWWIAGGYGTRFWVDDLYTIQPWLAMMGSTKDGMPGDPLARDLAYEMIESSLYDHRPDSSDPRELGVPTRRNRRGELLWNSREALLEHDPSAIGGDDHWGRGNGWGIYGIVQTLEYLDRPYDGGRYDEVIARGDLENLFVSLAFALKDRRTPDGGWSPHLGLTHLNDCPISETSATGLITYALAWGVNTGRLSREVFGPVVLQATAALQRKIDPSGDVLDIQPSGGGPACAFWSSNQSEEILNMNYGGGALVLANTEVMKFPDGELRGIH